MQQVAILLIGGLGTRIRPAIGDIPKCLAPVGTDVFLKILLDSIFKLGIERVILSLGYGSELILVEIKKFNLNFEYFIETEPLGTGGAIKAVMDAYMLDEALVYNGDSIILRGDARELLLPLNLDANELCRIASIIVDDKSRFGGVIHKNKRVTKFLEKGDVGKGLINAGMYRISKKAFMSAPRSKSYSLEADILPTLTANRALSLFEMTGEFIDIGIPEDYHKFKKLYLGDLDIPKAES